MNMDYLFSGIFVCFGLMFMIKLYQTKLLWEDGYEGFLEGLLFYFTFLICSGGVLASFYVAIAMAKGWMK